MSEAINQAQHDFWRPPLAAATAGRDRSTTCRCGTEYIVSSLYCHACGHSRPDVNSPSALEIPGVAELASVGERLGLTLPSVVAFLFGLICLVGALSVSLFFSVKTLVDWQAIQMWRMEWLLAAIAAFVAGCLLKKSTS